MRRSALRCMLAAALCAAVPGCVTYTPVGDVPPKAGATLRVEVVQPVAFTMPHVAYRDIVRVQGRLLYADRDSLVLAVGRVWSSSGETYLGEGVGIVIPRDNVRQVSGERLSAGKTLLAVGVGAAAVGTVMVAVGPLAGFGGDQKPKPQP